MKIERETAVDIFVRLGWKRAVDWDDDILASRLGKLHTRIGDEFELDDHELDNILDEVIAAGVEGEEFELVEKSEPDEDDWDAPVVPMKQPAKKPSKVVQELEEDDEEEPEDDEEEPEDDEESEEDDEELEEDESGPDSKEEVVWKPRKKTGRPYHAGRVLAEMGMDGGVTEAMAAEVDKRTGKPNPRESLYWLKGGWHVIRGYLDGMD